MIRFSWKKSLLILMPFNFKRWFKILIIVWLAGAGIGGCNFNGRNPAKEKPATAPAAQTDQTSPSVQNQEATVQSPASSQPVQKTNEEPAVAQPSSPAGTNGTANKNALPKTNPGIIGALVLLLIAISIFFMWLNSRFNFILLDTLTTGSDVIKEPFVRHRETGNSYFKWSLAFTGCLIGAVIFLGIPFVLGAGILKGNVPLAAVLAILGVLILTCVILGFSVVGSVVHDFVLPIAYQEKISVFAAWKKFMDAGAFRLGSIIKYLLTAFGLSIVIGIIQTIVGLIVLLVFGIAGGLIAIPGFFLIKAIPAIKPILILIGILFAVVLFLMFLIVPGLVMLPAPIFLRAFALSYLTRLYPGCDLLGFSGRETAQT
jgi:hypothetical protein